MENDGISEFKTKKWPQYFATLAATLGAFQLGLVCGWTSPGLPDMVERGDFGGLSNDQQSWIASTASMGCFCAVYPAGYLIQKFGRQPVMICVSVPFTIGWLFIAFGSNLEMIYIGRFITGTGSGITYLYTYAIAILYTYVGMSTMYIEMHLRHLLYILYLGFCSGIFSITAPVFIAETSEANIRGALGSCFQLLLVTGILFSYIVGAFVSWKWLAIICIVPSLVCELMLFFTPDSPRYLISIDDTDGAIKSLMWFRGASNFEQVKEEFIYVKVNVESNKKATYRDLLQPAIRKPISLVMLLLILQQASGCDAITLFTVKIFQDAGSTIDANLSTIIVGLVCVIFNLIAVVLTDRVGRRSLLLSTNFVLAMSLFVLGLFFFIQDDSGQVKLGWMPLASLIVFEAAFSLGIGPLAWLCVGELLPNHVIGIASSLSTSLLWLLSFLITKFFVPVNEALGQETCFWFFCPATIIGTLYMYFYMPETKGRTLDEVQALLN